MKALFIGRFQPFHNGHLKVLKKISTEFHSIIIGIGSSQYHNTLENPFSAEERKIMIEKTMQKAGINNYRIVFIPDIHNPPKWVDHVLSIYSDFDYLISNNDFTKKLFLEKGINVKKTPLFNKNEYSGKEIRKRIINDEPWEDLVPKIVSKIIKEIDGIKRLKMLKK